MAKRKQLKAQKRDILGRKAKKLRKEGILPANIYGAKVKSQAVQVDQKEFEKILSKTGETEILDLQVDKEKAPRPVLIHNVQLDPVIDHPLHADFLQVDLKEKVSIEVPIEFIGEAPAVKERRGILLELLNEVEVEALPTDLPSEIKVDVSALSEVDQAITIKDLKLPKEIEIKAGAEEFVCKIEAPRVEKEEKKVGEEAAPAPEEGKPKEKPATTKGAGEKEDTEKR